MGDSTLWFGYMEAGEKSAPVVRDSRLDTGIRSTVYLYNHRRGQILEYKREIIEPKLRELKTGEKDLVKELEAAYRTARQAFFSRSDRIAAIPERGEPPAQDKPRSDGDSEEDYGDDALLDDDADDGGEEDEDTED